MSTGNKLRAAAVAILIGAQCGVCVWQHFGSTRYFAWAPNDYFMAYDLQASVRGHALTSAQMSKRYRLSLSALVSTRAQKDIGLTPGLRYIWQDPPAEVKRRIRKVEATYSPAERATVRLDYQLDAGTLRHWQWPQ